VRDIEPAPSELAEGDTISADKAIYYNGLLEVANQDRTLRIGMTAQVSIVLEAVDNALSVPVAAVTDGPDGPSVQVWVGESAETRAVETGLNDKVQVQIVKGVAEGDQVVIGTGSNEAGASGGRRMGRPVGM